MSHEVISRLHAQATDQGGTAIEYALVASLIAATVAATLGAVGTRVVALFTSVADAFQASGF